jgi:Carboxypeptidase regulatory-like domain
MNKNGSGFTVCPRRNRHRSTNAFGGLLLFLLLMQASAWAQSTTALLFGTVHDPSGSPVPATSVKISNRQTGLIRTAITDTDGNYDFTLPRGLYDISLLFSQIDPPDCPARRIERPDLFLRPDF